MIMSEINTDHASVSRNKTQTRHRSCTAVLKKFIDKLHFLKQIFASDKKNQLYQLTTLNHNNHQI